MNVLFSYVSSFRQRAVALFHRNDQLKANADERRERWNQVIAEHQKPLERQQAISKSPVSGFGGSPSEENAAPKTP